MSGSGAAPGPGYGYRKPLIGSTTQAGALATTAPLFVPTAASNPGIMSSLFRFSYALIVLRVTAAATVVGDTLDIYIDTSGTGGQAANDWINIVHFPQVLGNGGVKTLVVPVNNMGATVVSPYDATADLAANATRAILYGDMLRVRYGTAGTGSFTFRVDVYTQ